MHDYAIPFSKIIYVINSSCLRVWFDRKLVRQDRIKLCGRRVPEIIDCLGYSIVPVSDHWKRYTRNERTCWVLLEETSSRNVLSSSTFLHVAQKFKPLFIELLQPRTLWTVYIFLVTFNEAHFLIGETFASITWIFFLMNICWWWAIRLEQEESKSRERERERDWWEERNRKNERGHLIEPMPMNVSELIMAFMELALHLLWIKMENRKGKQNVPTPL